jgi:hypothetical protein
MLHLAGDDSMHERGARADIWYFYFFGLITAAMRNFRSPAVA